MEEHLVPEDELIKTRLEKLEQMRALGKDPFAIEKYERYASVSSEGGEQEIEPFSADVIAAFERTESADESATQPHGQIIRQVTIVQGDLDAAVTGPLPQVRASLAGRVVSLRIMGKAAFADIQDRKGKVQVYLKKDDLGEDYEMVKLLDLGDFIGVKGFAFRTRTGEVTLHAGEITVLGKSIRPVPFGKEKGEQHWYGLHDVEQRYRQRHVDLITSLDSRQTFINRSRIIKTIRDFYESKSYLEVETPVLQSVAGGASAKPFLTYHNALEHEFHLRISLELYLKRLIVGGLERVFEIGRVFRNEGLSTRHSPEYTLLESYEAYADLEGVMDLVEDLFREVCKTLYGGTTFEYQGTVIDLAGPWKRLPILEGIEQYTGVRADAFATLASARAAMEGLGLAAEQEQLIGGVIEKIHERFVQPNLIQPTFLTDFPLDVSPLAKKRQDNPSLVRRFEIYLAKQEVGNAFSEINDPIDQRERFEQQAEMRAAGDEEAHPMDEDFIRALEYGMPPAGGLGVGIDRMVMIFTNQDNLRDVILYPQMKPEK